MILLEKFSSLQHSFFPHNVEVHLGPSIIYDGKYFENS